MDAADAAGKEDHFPMQLLSPEIQEMIMTHPVVKTEDMLKFREVSKYWATFILSTRRAKSRLVMIVNQGLVVDNMRAHNSQLFNLSIRKIFCRGRTFLLFTYLFFFFCSSFLPKAPTLVKQPQLDAANSTPSFTADTTSPVLMLNAVVADGDRVATTGSAC